MTKQNKKEHKYFPQTEVWKILSNYNIQTLRGLIALTYADTHACCMCGDVEWLRSTKESLFVHAFNNNKELFGKPQLRLPGYKNKLLLKDIIQPNGPSDAYLVLNDPKHPDDENGITAYAAYPAVSSLREQLDKGVKVLPFLVAGAALDIIKEKKKTSLTDKNIDISQVSVLSKHGVFDDVYGYYTNILEVEEISYGHTPMTRLTIEIQGLKLYLYVSKSLKNNYKLKVGDWISGEMALYAVKEYANG